MADALLASDPKDSSAYMMRGQIEADQNNFAAAAQDAQAALAINPNDKSAQVLLGMTQGRAAVSVPNLSAPQSAGSPGQRAEDSLAAPGGANAPGSSPSGSNFFNANAPGSPNAPQPGAVSGSINASSQFIGQARQDLSLGDYRGAIAQTTRALNADPLNVGAYAVRASAYMRGKNDDQALKDVAAGLQIDPNSQALMDAKAEAFNRLGRYAEAKAAAMLAIQNNPKDAKAYYELANALAGLGDKNGMIDALRSAAGIDPRYNRYLQAAMQIPSDQDLASLFDSGPDSNSAPAMPQGRGDKLSRFGVIAILSALGGILLAMGLIHAFSSEQAAEETVANGTSTAAMTTVTWPGNGNPLAENNTPPTLRGQYLIRRQIGAGGMGTVYEGYDTSLGRQVAVKRMRDEIKSDKRERERFISEAKLVASLHHPHIVDIYAIIEEGRDAYLIFEYVPGKTIREILSERGRLGLSEAVSIFRSMASALDYAHARGIVHRDLKPSNVMMSDEGVVKVMDFGIARAAKDAMTRSAMTGTILGTPPYMAPEQERGVVRKESDVYALGISLYEMLSGRLPFNGSGSGMLMNKINKEYAPLSSVAPGVPPALDRLMAQVFDPDPDKRIPSAKAFVAGLDEVLAQIQPA
ncbi:MAG TPA: protein kinase [Elusimicrobiota bacterium]|nr:protein kinase [Elusimicrobiota bacterium]